MTLTLCDQNRRPIESANWVAPVMTKKYPLRNKAKISLYASPPKKCTVSYIGVYTPDLGYVGFIKLDNPQKLNAGDTINVLLRRFQFKII